MKGSAFSPLYVGRPDEEDVMFYRLESFVELRQDVVGLVVGDLLDTFPVLLIVKTDTRYNTSHPSLLSNCHESIASSLQSTAVQPIQSESSYLIISLFLDSVLPHLVALLQELVIRRTPEYIQCDYPNFFDERYI